jgi:hypothetical protein
MNASNQHSLTKTNIRALMGKLSILKEFWDFLKIRKKWWLTPIVLVLLLLGAVVVATHGSAIAPFIYTLF